MYLLLIFLPLFSFLTLLLAGRFVGRSGAIFVSLLPIFTSFFIACFVFYEVTLLGANCSVILPFDWITVDLLVIEWHFLFDSLSASMLLVVFFVSSIVHLYSFEYMSEDPHLSRFVSYLSFFTFFMSILLTSGNFIQMFLGWEGVGLSSYLLINFWFTRAQANKSALKAMVVNRVGDWGLAFGIFLIFLFFGTVDFYTVFSVAPHSLLEKIRFLGVELYLADVITFFLFFGVVGKSAQFGLHTWLPDAMEGPTPVSALIHAATMVTAGVFLIVRCSYLFEYASFTLVLVSFIGGLTAFFASTAACFQTDLKKIIAYSTCSQLGYMIAACGLSLYSTALFHFFNHAFFKALLFLSAGSVIHALAGEQDIYNMGSLDVYLPLTSQMFLTGSVALTSFPFFAGFYSKDWILEVADSIFYFDNLLMTFFISQAAVFTMLYSDSLSSFVFDGDENFSISYLKHIGESGFKIVACLVLLALPAMFSGFIFKDLFIGFGVFTFSDAIYNILENITFLEADYLPVYWKLMPVFASFFLFFLIVFGFDFVYRWNFFYISVRFVYNFFAGYVLMISDFFSSSWWYDLILNHLTVYYYLPFCREVIFKLIDRGLLEYIGPYGLANLLSVASVRVSFLTSGYVYHYAFLLIFGFGISVFFCFFISDSSNIEFLVFEISLFSFFLTSSRH